MYPFEFKCSFVLGYSLNAIRRSILLLRFRLLYPLGFWPYKYRKISQKIFMSYLDTKPLLVFSQSSIKKPLFYSIFEQYLY